LLKRPSRDSTADGGEANREDYVIKNVRMFVRLLKR
jgi:hypothetical protein